MGLALALIGGAAHAQTAKKAATTKAPSPCQGLDAKACGANTACSWIKATKTKAGGERKAYCRLKSTPKKAPAKK
jgi:hypothetical protein